MSSRPLARPGQAGSAPTQPPPHDTVGGTEKGQLGSSSLSLFAVRLSSQIVACRFHRHHHRRFAFHDTMPVGRRQAKMPFPFEVVRGKVDYLPLGADHAARLCGLAQTGNGLQAKFTSPRVRPSPRRGGDLVGAKRG